MNEQITRRQHYVRKKYLLSWTGSNGQLWASRGDKVFPASPDNVLHERDFYRLETLNEEEKRLLHLFMGNNEVLTKLNQGWLEENQAICMLLQLLAGSSEDARMLLIQCGEEMQSMFERGAEMQCNALLAGNIDFWEDEEQKTNFLLYLCQQLFRSKNMRDRMINLVNKASKETRIQNVSGERVWKVLQYILMTNLAYNLGVLNSFKLILLENSTELKLITGDQPVVNLCVDLKENGEPKTLIMYYPLSPTRAIVLTEAAPKSGIRYNLKEEEVDLLNRRIADETEFSLVANSEELIKRYLASQNKINRFTA